MGFISVKQPAQRSAFPELLQGTPLQGYQQVLVSSNQNSENKTKSLTQGIRLVMQIYRMSYKYKTSLM